MPRLLASPKLGRWVVAALVAAGLVALPLAQASASERPSNGQIAFSAKRGGTRVIYARGANGAGLQLLPTGGRSDHPAFSPRGRRLLFTRYGPGGARLWTMYLDGTARRPLTGGPADGLGQWSPGGDQVVFSRGRPGHRRVYVVFADGTGLHQLTFGRDDTSPSWSVRDQIAFVRSQGGSSRIYAIRASGGKARRLTRGGANDTYPAWSPTGRTLVVARGRPGQRDLYLLTASGSHPRRLTALSGDESAPAWSPDASRIVFTYQRGRTRWVYVMKVRGGAIRSVRSRARVRRLSSSRSAASLPSWQAAGLSPVVAAAGDIACDPGSPGFGDGLGVPGQCRQRLTSNLLLRMDLSHVLTLGDDQYEDGQLWKFQTSFDPTWGRLKPLIRSVPGNHEYRDGAGDASGYFDYFNGPGRDDGPAAGARGKGYYSFEIGSWHVVALNSECAHIGGCSSSSPQIDWLRKDLATHPAACTVALWHRPTFTSGSNSDRGDMRPAWEALYAAGADVILSGHEHLYERFAPQTPTGSFDAAHGIREFIAGIGGRSRHAFTSVQPNSQARISGVFGVLQLTLRPGGYDWTVVAAPTGRVVDSGSGGCH